MPRSLILMRHAKQSSHATSDHERPLTDAGLEQAHAVGLRLAESGVLPDRVLSSTALRCRETWAGVEAALPGSLAIDFEETLYNASADQLFQEIAGIPDDVNSLLLLAHNPGISMLALALAGNREAEIDRLREGFSPATIARFDVEASWSDISPRNARLRLFERPETI